MCGDIGVGGGCGRSRTRGTEAIVWVAWEVWIRGYVVGSVGWYVGGVGAGNARGGYGGVVAWWDREGESVGPAGWLGGGVGRWRDCG